VGDQNGFSRTLHGGERRDYDDRSIETSAKGGVRLGSAGPCWAINPALTGSSLSFDLSNPQSGDTPATRPLAQMGKLRRGSCFLVLHQKFRFSLSPHSMTPDFVEGELPVLESLGFFLALLSIWLWTH
jgi:hypothetical protein